VLTDVAIHPDGAAVDCAAPTGRPATLRTAVVNDRRGLTVLLEGELDLSTSPGLYQELERLLALRPSALTLDLRRLTCIDSTGVSVLNTTRSHAASKQVRFALQAPAPAVERVLQATALWSRFDTNRRPFEDGAFEW
jgi:anti-sigma B factor antagonist